MDLYTLFLTLGVAGLGAMALLGLGHHGHAGHAGSTGHGGHGPHTGHAHTGHAHHDHGAVTRTMLGLMSPRVLFSLALGFGATGLVAHALSGSARVAVALLGGLALEALLVRPLWALLFRFASRPAMTLDSCITDEATVVSAFDADGSGIVRVALDGQIVQILGTLRPEDRPGPRLHAGDTVRIEDVDTAHNRCTVSRSAR